MFSLLTRYTRVPCHQLTFALHKDFPPYSFSFLFLIHSLFFFIYIVLHNLVRDILAVCLIDLNTLFYFSLFVKLV